MIAGSLNTAVQDVMLQGCIFLDRVGEATYARPLESPDDEGPSASLGAHYRHVLDHFLCLAEGIHTGQVNYDQRGRNKEVENSVICARLMTEQLINEFAGLSGEALQRQCTVTYMVGYDDAWAGQVNSNLAREVMFCVGHAIHHYAILKLLCAREGIRLPYAFGIAPSTLKHLGAAAVGWS